MRALLFGVHARVCLEESFDKRARSRFVPNRGCQWTAGTLQRHVSSPGDQRCAPAKAFDQRRAGSGALLERSAIRGRHRCRQLPAGFHEERSPGTRVQPVAGGGSKGSQCCWIRHRQRQFTCRREVIFRGGLPSRSSSYDAASHHEPISLQRDQVDADRIVGDPEPRRERIHGAFTAPDQVQHGLTRRRQGG